MRAFMPKPASAMTALMSEVGTLATVSMMGLT